MIFTREDILKILNALLQLGRKDSEFKEANTPLSNDDYIAILLDGINKKVSINNLLSTLGLLKKDDFINVSDRYDEYYIQLSEAINIIANNKRKKGLVITFQDINGNWKIYQFTNEISNFIKTEYWKDLSDFKYPIVNSILPDEEDLTLTYPNIDGNSFIQLKDKEYDPENFSGMATKILRKNIIEIEGVRKNIITLDDFNLESCIYEIRYDFDLNNLTINIPSNCILNFNGGTVKNGTINVNNTLIKSDIKSIFINIIINGLITNIIIYPEWFHNLETEDYRNAVKLSILVAPLNAIILFTKDKYYILALKPSIPLKSNITLKSNTKSIIYTQGNTPYDTWFHFSGNNIVISGLEFDLWDTTDTNLGVSESRFIFDGGINSNIIIENCLFKTCGQNAIYLNNHAAKDIFIINNTFEFKRVPSSKIDYDSSILNVKTISHFIIGNKIACSNNEALKSHGAIESHGYGIVLSNTIINCNIAIYVCNDIREDSASLNYEYFTQYGLIVSNNIINNCDVGINLWSELGSLNYSDGRTFPPLKNILISNNNGKDVKNAISLSQKNNFGKISIIGNCFSGKFATLGRVGAIEMYPQTIRLHSSIEISTNSGIENLSIIGNKFDNYVVALLGSSVKNTDSINIIMKNNIYTRLFNCELIGILESGMHLYLRIVHFFLLTVNAIIKDNIFECVEDNNMSYYLDIDKIILKNILKDNVVNIEKFTPNSNNIYILNDNYNICYPKDSLLINMTDLGIQYSKVTKTGRLSNHTYTINCKLHKVFNNLYIIINDEDKEKVHANDYVTLVTDTINTRITILTISGRKLYTNEFSYSIFENLDDGVYDCSISTIPIEIINLPLNAKGTTENRPKKDITEGFEYYDSTLKKKILWNGTSWVNVDGTGLE